MKTESITQAQAAALLRVTARRLRQMDAEPNPPTRNATGKYPAGPFGEWMEQRLTSEDAAEIDYAFERARLTRAQAEKAELEVKEILGEVVRMPLVELHWQGMVASMRAKLLALPHKAAGVIAAPDKLIAVQETLREFVHEALNEIAGGAIPDDLRARHETHREAGESSPAQHTN
jgi:hypothetical protein